MRKIKTTLTNQITKKQEGLISSLCTLVLDDIKEHGKNVEFKDASAMFYIIMDAAYKERRLTLDDFKGTTRDLATPIFESRPDILIVKGMSIHKKIYSTLLQINAIIKLVEAAEKQKKAELEIIEQRVAKWNEIEGMIAAHPVSNLKDIIGDEIVRVITYGEIVDAYSLEDERVEVRLALELKKGVLYFLHEQDCCESVELYDGLDELKSIVGQKILNAYVAESNNDDDTEWVVNGERDSEIHSEVVAKNAMIVGKSVSDSHTWTFYNISTASNDASLRFLGESNGYYCESVQLAYVPKVLKI